MGKQLGVIGRRVLGLKLRMPAGVTLNDNEAQAVIDDWNKQMEQANQNPGNHSYENG